MHYVAGKIPGAVVLFRDYLAVRKCAAPVVGWLCFYWLSHCRIWFPPTPSRSETDQGKAREGLGDYLWRMYSITPLMTSRFSSKPSRASRFSFAAWIPATFFVIHFPTGIFESKWVSFKLIGFILIK
jgi:hypothetical protein